MIMITYKPVFYISRMICSLYFLLIFFVGCGGTVKQVKSDNSSSPQKSQEEVSINIPDDPSQLLPAGCFGIATIDIPTLTKWPAFQNYMNLIEEDLSTPDKRIGDFILDNTQQVVVGVVSSEDSVNKYGYILIMQGNYDISILSHVIDELKSNNKGQGLKQPTIFEPTKDGSFPEFLDDGKLKGIVVSSQLIVIANHELVPQIVELLMAKDIPRFVDSDTYKRIYARISTKKSALTVVTSTPDSLKSQAKPTHDSKSPFAKYSQVLDNIRAFGLAIDLENNVQIQLTAETSFAKQAKDLISMMNGLRFVAKIAVDDPSFHTLIDQLEINQNGVYVDFNLAANHQQIEELVKLIKDKTK